MSVLGTPSESVMQVPVTKDSSASVALYFFKFEKCQFHVWHPGLFHGIIFETNIFGVHYEPVGYIRLFCFCNVP